jgi:hypothetical protein
MHPRSRTRLSDVLARQDDVITFAQVVDAGADAGLPAREVAGGRWQQLCVGIYLASTDPATDRQWAWCAQLRGDEGGVVTGAHVCRMRGVGDVPDLPATVLVSEDCQRAELPGVQCRRTSRPAEFHEDKGLRLAGTTRAIVDAARQCASLQDVRGLIMASVNGKHTTAAALRRELDDGPRRGSGWCRRALDDWDDGARSAPEAEAADWLRDEVRAGRCPPFLLNPTVVIDGVELGSPDIYVPGTALGNEMDSRRHHGSENDLDATLLRHRRFADHALVLEHVTPARFRRDRAGWARTFAALAEGRRHLGDPAGLVVKPAGPLQPVHGRRRRSPSA